MVNIIVNIPCKLKYFGETDSNGAFIYSELNIPVSIFTIEFLVELLKYIEYLSDHSPRDNITVHIKTKESF